MGEHVLPRDMTVYQAVQQFGGAGSGFTDDSDSDNRNTSMFGSPGIWARYVMSVQYASQLRDLYKTK